MTATDSTPTWIQSRPPTTPEHEYELRKVLWRAGHYDLPADLAEEGASIVRGAERLLPAIESLGRRFKAWHDAVERVGAQIPSTGRDELRGAIYQQPAVDDVWKALDRLSHSTDTDLLTRP